MQVFPVVDLIADSANKKKNGQHNTGALLLCTKHWFISCRVSGRVEDRKMPENVPKPWLMTPNTFVRDDRSTVCGTKAGQVSTP